MSESSYLVIIRVFLVCLPASFMQAELHELISGPRRTSAELTTPLWPSSMDLSGTNGGGLDHCTNDGGRWRISLCVPAKDGHVSSRNRLLPNTLASSRQRHDHSPPVLGMSAAACSIYSSFPASTPSPTMDGDTLDRGFGAAG